MYNQRYKETEPDYFRKPYPDNEALYIYFDMAFPRYSKAYRFGDERRTRYDDYASNYITSIFGTEDKLKKPYMKRLENYTIITNPNQFVRDYNELVEGLQKWCRTNHITYRAIGAPDLRIYKLRELYERNIYFLRRSEEQYEKWDKLRSFSENMTVENNMIKLGREGVRCSCYHDFDDGIYGWYIDFPNIGHIGGYRLAIDTQFDRIDDIFHLPVQLPNTHVKLYLTMLGDNFSNPWADIKETYPIRVEQISDLCCQTIRKLIYSAIEEFDRSHRKYKLFEDDREETWGSNFFRIIKEDFNVVEDINILFEDGKVWKNGNDIEPEEAVNKYKKEIEEIKPYLN